MFRDWKEPWRRLWPLFDIVEHQNKLYHGESPSTENQQIFPTTVFNHTWEVPNCIAREGGREGVRPGKKCSNYNNYWQSILLMTNAYCSVSFKLCSSPRRGMVMISAPFFIIDASNKYRMLNMELIQFDFNNKNNGMVELLVFIIINLHQRKAWYNNII